MISALNLAILPWSVIMIPHLVCVDPDRNTKGPSQAKVCKFDNTFVVNQEVLGFQVPVEDSTTVTKVNAL